mmetsp:Transcript_17655/g.45673  ORF Transcript_17655/g.45673 Transcript_17655/m.45673 type:complete len:206 (-) Transcript_17655:460-1077(-)
MEGPKSNPSGSRGPLLSSFSPPALTLALAAFRLPLEGALPTASSKEPSSSNSSSESSQGATSGGAPAGRAAAGSAKASAEAAAPAVPPASRRRASCLARLLALFNPARTASASAGFQPRPECSASMIASKSAGRRASASAFFHGRCWACRCSEAVTGAGTLRAPAALSRSASLTSTGRLSALSASNSFDGMCPCNFNCSCNLLFK